MTDTVPAAAVKKTAAKKAAAPKMTAADVKHALRSRWPAAENVYIDEAPDGPMRLGRKLDVLVVSTWRGRGFELDGVEIKVSMSDWKRELDKPEKADWWWEHVHRFWIACPAKIAVGIRAELPSGWGLLAVSEGRSEVIVKPAKHDAEPFTWAETVGLLRAACNAGPGALERARQGGYAQGLESGRREAHTAQPDVRAQRELEQLRAKVDAFKTASGVDLDETYGAAGAARIGRLVNLLERSFRDPAQMDQALRRSAETVHHQAVQLNKMADDLMKELLG